MSITNQMDIEELDVEWIHLISTARQQGLSIDDVRTFLRNPDLPAQNMDISTNKRANVFPK